MSSASRTKKWRGTPGGARWYRMWGWKRLGMDPVAAEAMWQEKHEAGCDICGGRTINMAIDHNHTTGVIRGWLCLQCNTHLGWLERNHNAVETYLERTK